jgi:hypothetical protein
MTCRDGRPEALPVALMVVRGSPWVTFEEGTVAYLELTSGVGLGFGLGILRNCNGVGLELAKLDPFGKFTRLNPQSSLSSSLRIRALRIRALQFC